MLRKLIFLLAIATYSVSFSQAKKTVHVKFIKERITVNGSLDELAWSEAKPAKDFWQYFPSDTVQATSQTEIKMLFDDRNLYVGIKVNTIGDNYIIPSLRRDFRASGNDNISLIFDTFNDGTNAFLFGTNPYGVLREALISGGGTDVRGFDTSWDTKWIGETKIYDGYYEAEWMIPLSAFKYNEGETKWRFNSYQFDTQTNERSTWMNIPQNQVIFSLAYMGDMVFEQPLGKSKSPISIIPYVNGITSKDFEENISESSVKVGGDAKFTIGNSLNLDLTFNPDFSQVEVDQQVTNLTRFEVSLPERRQFFIENSDLFGDFGNNRDSNPFFSRRIGIAYDLEDNSIENKIIAGVRLSGKLTNNLRIGLLSVQTEEDIENHIPTSNNSVIAIQQKLFSRSNVSLIFVNKQSTKDYDFLADEDEYNRVIGLDYRLASADNSWVGKYFFHKSFAQNTSSKDYSAGISTEYNNRNYTVRLSGVFVGANYRSDLGFIRRTDILKIDPSVERAFWPSKGIVQKHSFSVTPIFIWAPSYEYQNSDYNIITRYQANFTNTSELQFEIFKRYTYLYDPFDPTGTDDAIELPENKGYHYTSFNLNFRSDLRKEFSYNIEPSVGQFYNGDRYSVRGTLNWRLQPYFTSSVQINYNRILLPSPYPSASIWLIGPRIDVTFNKNVFWSSFIQYNSQETNFGINTRLQWRFAPLSDLFVVYNDNYMTDDSFVPRSRSFNIKLTYWLNI